MQSVRSLHSMFYMDWFYRRLWSAWCKGVLVYAVICLKNISRVTLNFLIPNDIWARGRLGHSKYFFRFSSPPNPLKYKQIKKIQNVSKWLNILEHFFLSAILQKKVFLFAQFDNLISEYESWGSWEFSFISVLFFEAVRIIKDKKFPFAPFFSQNLDENLKIYLVWP